VIALIDEVISSGVAVSFAFHLRKCITALPLNNLRAQYAVGCQYDGEKWGSRLFLLFYEKSNIVARGPFPVIPANAGIHLRASARNNMKR